MIDLRSRLQTVFVLEAGAAGTDALVQAGFAAERAGATAVELCLDHVVPRELARVGRALVCQLRVPVLIAQRADVALAIGAAGVHLMPGDVPAPMVRRIAPRGFLVGASVGTRGQIEHGRGADYWVIGPWRADGGKGLGSSGFSALVRHAEGRPCVAGGGVHLADFDDVLAVGGCGLRLPELPGRHSRPAGG